MDSPYSPQNTAAHDQAFENWKAYRKGDITLSELITRNNRIVLKTELKIEKVAPKEVSAAVKVFNGSAKRVEHGCPVEKDDPDGPGWNS